MKVKNLEQENEILRDCFKTVAEKNKNAHANKSSIELMEGPEDEHMSLRVTKG